jgi:hypothetical protein
MTTQTHAEMALWAMRLLHSGLVERNLMRCNYKQATAAVKQIRSDYPKGRPHRNDGSRADLTVDSVDTASDKGLS